MASNFLFPDVYMICLLLRLLWTLNMRPCISNVLSEHRDLTLLQSYFCNVHFQLTVIFYSHYTVRISYIFFCFALAEHPLGYLDDQSSILWSRFRSLLDVYRICRRVKSSKTLSHQNEGNPPDLFQNLRTQVCIPFFCIQNCLNANVDAVLKKGADSHLSSIKTSMLIQVMIN